MRILLIGFGTVGQGFTELVMEKRDELNRAISIVGVYDVKMGGVLNPGGLEPELLLEAAREGKLSSLKGGFEKVDVLSFIKETAADVLVEVTYTNLEDGEPAYSHVKQALMSGKHVVTSNKGPVALYYRELITLAKSKGVEFKFEGTVLSGTPAINLVTHTLKGAKINEIRGILNGTTNFILEKMEKGATYEEALKEAQKLGYAEADPRGDVEGWDAMAKILILSNAIMDANIKKEDVDREGITGISPQMIKEALEEGKRWKLVAEARWDEGRFKASVKPRKVSKEDKLFPVNGVLNSIVFTTDTLGEVQIIGPGAGRRETGYAILTDILSIK